MIRTIAYWGIYGRAVSEIVLEDSKTPLGRNISASKCFLMTHVGFGFAVQVGGMNRV